MYAAGAAASASQRSNNDDDEDEPPKPSRCIVGKSAYSPTVTSNRSRLMRTSSPGGSGAKAEAETEVEAKNADANAKKDKQASDSTPAKIKGRYQINFEKNRSSRKKTLTTFSPLKSGRRQSIVTPPAATLPARRRLAQSDTPNASSSSSSSSSSKMAAPNESKMAAPADSADPYHFSDDDDDADHPRRAKEKEGADTKEGLRSTDPSASPTTDPPTPTEKRKHADVDAAKSEAPLSPISSSSVSSSSSPAPSSVASGNATGNKRFRLSSTSTFQSRNSSYWMSSSPPLMQTKLQIIPKSSSTPHVTRINANSKMAAAAQAQHRALATAAAAASPPSSASPSATGGANSNESEEKAAEAAAGGGSTPPPPLSPEFCFLDDDDDDESISAHESSSDEEYAPPTTAGQGRRGRAKKADKRKTPVRSERKNASSAKLKDEYRSTHVVGRRRAVDRVFSYNEEIGIYKSSSFAENDPVEESFLSSGGEEESPAEEEKEGKMKEREKKEEVEKEEEEKEEEEEEKKVVVKTEPKTRRRSRGTPSPPKRAAPVKADRRKVKVEPPEPPESDEEEPEEREEPSPSPSPPPEPRVTRTRSKISPILSPRRRAPAPKVSPGAATRSGAKSASKSKPSASSTPSSGRKVSFGKDVIAEAGRSRRMASLNAMAMVNLLYEDDARPGILKSRTTEEEEEAKETKTRGKRKRSRSQSEEDEEDEAEEDEDEDVMEEPEGVTIGKYSMRTSTSHVRKSSIFLSSFGNASSSSSSSTPPKKSPSPRHSGSVDAGNISGGAKRQKVEATPPDRRSSDKKARRKIVLVTQNEAVEDTGRKTTPRRESRAAPAAAASAPAVAPAPAKHKTVKSRLKGRVTKRKKLLRRGGVTSKFEESIAELQKEGSRRPSRVASLNAIAILAAVTDTAPAKSSFNKTSEADVSKKDDVAKDVEIVKETKATTRRSKEAALEASRLKEAQLLAEAILDVKSRMKQRRKSSPSKKGGVEGTDKSKGPEKLDLPTFELKDAEFKQRKPAAKMKRDTGLDIAKEDLKESIFKGLEKPKKSSPKKGGRIKEESEGKAEAGPDIKDERKALVKEEEKKVEPKETANHVTDNVNGAANGNDGANAASSAKQKSDAEEKAPTTSGKKPSGLTGLAAYAATVKKQVQSQPSPLKPASIAASTPKPTPKAPTSTTLSNGTTSSHAAMSKPSVAVPKSQNGPAPSTSSKLLLKDPEMRKEPPPPPLPNSTTTSTSDARSSSSSAYHASSSTTASTSSPVRTILPPRKDKAARASESPSTDEEGSNVPQDLSLHRKSSSAPSKDSAVSKDVAGKRGGTAGANGQSMSASPARPKPIRGHHIPSTIPLPPAPRKTASAMSNASVIHWTASGYLQHHEASATHQRDSKISDLAAAAAASAAALGTAAHAVATAKHLNNSGGSTGTCGGHPLFLTGAATATDGCGGSGKAEFTGTAREATASLSSRPPPPPPPNFPPSSSSSSVSETSSGREDPKGEAASKASGTAALSAAETAAAAGAATEQSEAAEKDTNAKDSSGRCQVCSFGAFKFHCMTAAYAYHQCGNHPPDERLPPPPFPHPPSHTSSKNPKDGAKSSGVSKSKDCQKSAPGAVSSATPTSGSTKSTAPLPSNVKPASVRESSSADPKRSSEKASSKSSMSSSMPPKASSTASSTSSSSSHKSSSASKSSSNHHHPPAPPSAGAGPISTLSLQQAMQQRMLAAAVAAAAVGTSPSPAQSAYDRPGGGVPGKNSHDPSYLLPTDYRNSMEVTPRRSLHQPQPQPPPAHSGSASTLQQKQQEEQRQRLLLEHGKMDLLQQRLKRENPDDDPGKGGGGGGGSVGGGGRGLGAYFGALSRGADSSGQQRSPSRSSGGGGGGGSGESRKRRHHHHHSHAASKTKTEPRPLDDEDLASIAESRPLDTEAALELCLRDNDPLVPSFAKQLAKLRLESWLFDNCEQNENLPSYYGWRWIGSPRERLVMTQLDGTATMRKCYPAIYHVTEGDIIRVRDTVLLRSASSKDLPYVAKIAALWENEKGDYFMTLFWYYRPEQLRCKKKNSKAPPATTTTTTTNDADEANPAPPLNPASETTTRVLKSALHLNNPLSSGVDDITKSRVVEFMNSNEVFATKHLDYNSVACIEDRCFVLTFNEYSRYRAKLQSRIESAALGDAALCDAVNRPRRDSVMPEAGVAREKLGRRLRLWRQPPDNIDPGLVFCCRKVFDFRQQRILKNPGA